MDELEHHFADVEIGGENRHENLSPMHGQFDEQVENSDENSVEGDRMDVEPGAEEGEGFLRGRAQEAALSWQQTLDLESRQLVVWQERVGQVHLHSMAAFLEGECAFAGPFARYLLLDQPLPIRLIASFAPQVLRSRSWGQLYAWAGEISEKIGHALAAPMYSCSACSACPQEEAVPFPPGLAPLSDGERSTGRLVAALVGLFSSSVVWNTMSAHCFRNVLSLHNPPIADLIEVDGLVNRLIQFLSSDLLSLQFESAWALTNFLTGISHHTERVISFGVLPAVTTLIDKLHDAANEPNLGASQPSALSVLDQCFWLLGNVAGDSSRLRDMVLVQCDQLVEKLCAILDHAAVPISVKRNSVWTLSNLCRHKPRPDWRRIALCLPTLGRLLHSQDDEVLADVCWSLSYISDGDNSRIGSVINLGVVPRLIELLQAGAMTIQTPALRVIGNLVTGDDAQTELVLSIPEFWAAVLRLLDRSNRPGIRKESMWILSNIAAGNADQIQSLLDSACLPACIQSLRDDCFDVRKEAVWVVVNICSGGRDTQIERLVIMGAIESLIEILDDGGPSKVAAVTLDAIEKFAQFSKRDFKMPSQFEPLFKAEFISTLKSMRFADKETQQNLEKAILAVESRFQTGAFVNGRKSVS